MQDPLLRDGSSDVAPSCLRESSDVLGKSSMKSASFKESKTEESSGLTRHESTGSTAVVDYTNHATQSASIKSATRGSFSESDLVVASRSGKKWQTAVKKKIVPFVGFKQQCHKFAEETKLMKDLENDRKWKYVFLVAFIVIITMTGVVMAQSRAALFHMKAVGLWDDGNAYVFSYPWSVTFLAFTAQSIIGIGKAIHHERTKAKRARRGSIVRKRDTNRSKKELNEAKWTRVNKYWIVIQMGFVEIASQYFSSWALVCGVPATIFVVFKSSGMVWMAIIGRLKGRKLGWPQWLALAVLWCGLILATLSERGGGGRRAGRRRQGSGEANSCELVVDVGGTELFAQLGVVFLLLGDFLRSIVLQWQEVALISLWKSPIQLQGTAALVGLAQTVLMLIVSRHYYMKLPDGHMKPMSDVEDVITMCMNSHALLAVIVIHLVSHVSSEISHMVILQHISAIARSICDAFKIIVIWFNGKVFWYLGIFAPLAEPWNPGVTGSIMMLPAMTLVVYGILMFKENDFFPITLFKNSKGSWRIGFKSVNHAAHPHLVTHFDGSFYDHVWTKALTREKMKFMNPDLTRSCRNSILAKHPHDSDYEDSDDVDDIRETGFWDETHDDIREDVVADALGGNRNDVSVGVHDGAGLLDISGVDTHFLDNFVHTSSHKDHHARTKSREPR